MSEFCKYFDVEHDMGELGLVYGPSLSAYAKEGDIALVNGEGAPRSMSEVPAALSSCDDLRTVDQVLRSLEKFPKKKIFIPSYQRGYRWTPDEARQLLDDVYTWEGGPYFLQLLAVREDEEKHHLRIIDGQQRLTTSLLILSELEERDYVKEWIEFESREIGNGIDLHYRNMVSNSIRDWLSKRSPDEKENLRKAIRNAQFLYFKVDAAAEADFFSRINTWKITATDSELVKCLLLSREDNEEKEKVDKRAFEWNQVERWLSREDVWGFLDGARSKCEDRMGQLLEFTGITNIKRESKDYRRFPLYEAFKKELESQESSRDKIWEEVYIVYSLLQKWFSDRHDKHLIGWYLHRKGEKLPSKVDCGILDDAINEARTLSVGARDWLTKPDIYSTGGDKLHNYLLLANVAWCCVKECVDYDFSRHSSVRKWSLEHVHARNQGCLDESEFMSLTFRENGVDKEALWKKYSEIKDKKEAQKRLEEVLADYPEEDEDNSLGNMALLPQDANSSLTNKLFVGKRREVLSWALEGQESFYWAPPLTVAMFTKEAGCPEEKFNAFWGKKDRKNFMKLIASVIEVLLGHYKKVEE